MVLLAFWAWERRIREPGRGELRAFRFFIGIVEEKFYLFGRGYSTKAGANAVLRKAFDEWGATAPRKGAAKNRKQA
jgi:hypothetical protein